MPYMAKNTDPVTARLLFIFSLVIRLHCCTHREFENFYYSIAVLLEYYTLASNGSSEKARRVALRHSE